MSFKTMVLNNNTSYDQIYNKLIFSIYNFFFSKFSLQNYLFNQIMFYSDHEYYLELQILRQQYIIMSLFQHNFCKSYQNVFISSKLLLTPPTQTKEQKQQRWEAINCLIFHSSNYNLYNFCNKNKENIPCFIQDQTMTKNNIYKLKKY